MKIDYTDCGACDGTGRAIDPVKTGKAMRKLRERAGIRQSAIADALDISVPMVSLLESGKRNWSIPMMQTYQTLCAL